MDEKAFNNFLNKKQRWIVYITKTYTFMIYISRLNDPFSLGNFSICVNFVIPFNYFERLGLIVFMYHMFIINQQVACCKSVMPYDYHPHATKLWLISKTVSKGKSNNSLRCGLTSKHFINPKYKTDIHKMHMHLRTT